LYEKADLFLGFPKKGLKIRILLKGSVFSPMAYSPVLDNKLWTMLGQLGFGKNGLAFFVSYFRLSRSP